MQSSSSTVDVGLGDHVQRPGDAALERAPWRTDARRSRLGAPGDAALAVGFSVEARHQRAVAQHELARLVVGGGGEVQRAAGDHQAVEHQRAARADRRASSSPAAAISGRAPLRAATTTSTPGASGVGHAVDLERRRLARRSGCRRSAAGRRRGHGDRGAAAARSPSPTRRAAGAWRRRRPACARTRRRRSARDEAVVEGRENGALA